MINLGAYKKLGNREKVLLVVFSLIITAGIYYHFLYKPIVKNMHTYKFQIQKLTTRLNEIQAKYPQIDAQNQRLSLLKDESKELFANIAEIENKLPSKRGASQLVAEVGRLAKDFKLTSIQQKIDTGDEYSRIFVELKFRASYNQAVNYVKGLESISPYLKIEEMEVSEPKGRLKRSGVEGRIVLSSLLGEIPISVPLRAKEAEDTASSKLRDIFTSKTKVVAESHTADLKLEGITYNPRSSTAIINDEVVKIGSKIGEFQVKEILSDTVILTDGYEEHILSIAR